MPLVKNFTRAEVADCHLTKHFVFGPERNVFEIEGNIFATKVCSFELKRNVFETQWKCLN